jgi:hypothetical protein
MQTEEFILNRQKKISFVVSKKITPQGTDPCTIVVPSLCATEQGLQEEEIAKASIHAERFFDEGFRDYIDLEGVPSLGQLLIRISPLTEDVGFPYAVLVSGGEYKLADKIVSHTWSDKFFHMVAAVLADASNQCTYEDIAKQMSAGQFEDVQALLDDTGAMEVVYWICCFAVNQHGAHCHENLPKPCNCRTKKHLRGKLSEMNKFDVMMRYLKVRNIERSNQNCEGRPSTKRLGQVCAIDTGFEVFTRTWCLAELVEADNSFIDQVLVIHSYPTLQDVCGQVDGINIQHANVTCEEDKRMILAKIADTRAFNDKVRSLVSQIFTSMEIERLRSLSHHPGWFVSAWFSRIRVRMRPQDWKKKKKDGYGTYNLEEDYDEQNPPVVDVDEDNPEVSQEVPVFVAEV